MYYRPNDKASQDFYEMLDIIQLQAKSALDARQLLTVVIVI